MAGKLRVLIDLNIILDVLQEREPFFAASARVLACAETGLVEGIVAAHTLTTLFYLVAKDQSADRARVALTELLQFLSVGSVEHTTTIEQALNLPYSDFEDAVQMMAAVHTPVVCDGLPQHARESGVGRNGEYQHGQREHTLADPRRCRGRRLPRIHPGVDRPSTYAPQQSQKFDRRAEKYRSICVRQQARDQVGRHQRRDQKQAGRSSGPPRHGDAAGKPESAGKQDVQPLHQHHDRHPARDKTQWQPAV